MIKFYRPAILTYQYYNQFIYNTYEEFIIDIINPYFISY